MALAKDLENQVNNIIQSSWKVHTRGNVPKPENVGLRKGAAEFEGTVLYSDLAQSSQLANDFQRKIAAKIVKCFLFCCSRLITVHGGVITSFDGDRVMGIFTGSKKETNAAITALKINYAVREIIRPMIERQFENVPESRFQIHHAVGIDTSNIFAVRAGLHGAGDLVWIGRAPNFAAKLSDIRQGDYASFISQDVYARLEECARYGDEYGQQMWESVNHSWIGKNWTIYRSSWHWEP